MYCYNLIVMTGIKGIKILDRFPGRLGTQGMILLIIQHLVKIICINCDFIKKEVFTEIYGKRYLLDLMFTNEFVWQVTGCICDQADTVFSVVAYLILFDHIIDFNTDDLTMIFYKIKKFRRIIGMYMQMNLVRGTGEDYRVTAVFQFLFEIC